MLRFARTEQKVIQDAAIGRKRRQFGISRTVDTIQICIIHRNFQEPPLASLSFFILKIVRREILKTRLCKGQKKIMSASLAHSFCVRSFAKVVWPWGWQSF